MDQQRGRSPSAGNQHAQNINNRHSPSPGFQGTSNSGGLGIGLESSNTNSETPFSNGAFNSNNLAAYDVNNQFLNTSSSPFAQGNLAESSFTPGQEFTQQFKQEFPNQSISPFNNQQQSFTQDLLDPNLSSDYNQNDYLFQPSNGQGEQFEQSLFLNDNSKNQSVNPADIMSDMSSPPGQVNTPPNLLQPDMRRTSSQQSPSNFNQHQFQGSPAHSRNASLGPESAAFVNGQQPDWNTMSAQFQGHRRTQSEYSDVSSVAPSPNLPHLDSFDGEQGHSPMVNPQDAGLYQEVLGIGNFSLSDPQLQGSSPRPGLSPSHSPAISPRITPQSMPALNQQQQQPFMLNMNQFGQSQVGGFYSNQAQSNESFPQLQQTNSSSEMGQAQQMVPPEINVEFAPASRQNSFEPPKPSLDQDALTPPDRGRNRRRAISDPYHPAIGSRPSTPGIGSSLSVSPSSQPSRSLSPLDRSGAISPGGRRRQSTSSLPNRDYILGLADPDYQPVSGGSESGSSKRVQKHPATFQCTLCPKRFTRAYNLRSHLRTHTDERPFVCTVCGKAFARQHDRKRHEGLHSGEKKFVCKGDLKQGGQWGCGRRFARADALGRHFRSEAGRICIKPLLEEEAIERQRIWQEQQMQNMAQSMQQPQPLPLDANGFPMDNNGNYALPAALLAQYPALATLSWSDLPQGEPEDHSGRNSFDASGSEYYEEGDEGGYVSGPGTSYSQQPMSEGFQGGYASDYGGR